MQQGHLIFELVFAILALGALIAILVCLLRINQALQDMKISVEATRRRIEPILQEAQTIVQEARAGVTALVERTQAAAAMVTTTAEEISQMAHEQAIELRALARDSVLVARNQVERWDDLLVRTAARVDETAALVQKEVLDPIKEFHCLMVGVRSALGVLFARRRQIPVDKAYQDEEMFI